MITNIMFEPKGEKPYWELIFEYVKDKEVGDTISYDELSRAIDGDIVASRSAVYKARKKLLEYAGNFLEIERGIGYKVVNGMDIMLHAKGRQKSAKRQIVAADYETSNIEVAELSPEEKKKLQDFMYHNANIQQAFLKRTKAVEMGVKATREHLVGAEARVASAQVTQLFTEDQLKKLRKLVE